MSSKQLSALFWLVTLAFPGTTVAAPSDTSVCVDVVVRRPKNEAQPNKAPEPADASQAQATPPVVGANDTERLATTRPQGVAAVEISSTQGMSTVVAAAARPAVDSGSEAEFSASGSESADLRLRSGAHLPVGQTPKAYLKRLIEHFVTHERGFVAATEDCSQRIVVELYPLQVGWAAFARYTGNGREERVDQLLPTELSQFAERATTALLHDVTIAETVDRDNVLWSDSLHSTQRIRGRNHFLLGLGTRLRGGYFDTAVTDRNNPRYGQTENTLRLFSPMAVMAGYRGVFDQFGVEALGQFDLGTSQTAAKNNPGGGHVDYAGSLGLVLHVSRYTDPRGIASLYYGAGATFELVWFSAIIPATDRLSDSRSTLMGGGLNADALVGYEFMRASAVSFFLQGELNIPAYVLRSENGAGTVNTWFPGMKLALGANF
jgi:hypothetical protein